MTDPAPGIAYILFATLLSARKETFVPANDVSFTVSTERRSYSAGQQITLKYRVANISNAPLYVPREWEVQCPTAPHVWAWFENSSGQHFVPGYGGSCSPSINSQNVSARMRKEAVLLKPGEHLDGTLQMDTTLFGWLRTRSLSNRGRIVRFGEREIYRRGAVRTSPDALPLVAVRITLRLTRNRHGNGWHSLGIPPASCRRAL